MGRSLWPRTVAHHFQRYRTDAAVARGIMGHASEGPRLGAIKRLNQRLFIQARHQRALGRIKIGPSNVLATRPIPCGKLPEQERHVVSDGKV
jgi:hypothetical protein